jgi:hypothetical protein
MPKLRNLLIAVAAAMLITSAALADTTPEDQSYLPPQSLRSQAKESDMRAGPQTETRFSGKRYGMRRSRTHRQYAHWRGRRDHATRNMPFLPRIFSALFR